MANDPVHNLTAEDMEKKQPSFLDLVRGFFSKEEEPTASLHETFGGLIEENGNSDDDSDHERRLIANVLSVSTLTAEDVMMPRADIVAIDIESTTEELLALLTERTFSRIPVYKESLDDVVGCINAKDILVCLARGERPIVKEIIRDVMVVSPSLDALDLFLEMRETRKHMALVVDEFGGIDGLITIGDMIEAIVGEIDDEHDEDDDPQLVQNSDGTILADGRVDIAKFEEEYGPFLTESDDEDIDTLGGLVMAIAGRMPTRGELLKHSSGLEIEVIDADARRVKTLRIHKIASKEELETQSDA